MTFKHPNQFFIDNFYLPNGGKKIPYTAIYSKEHLDKKKKEKFQYFVESITKEPKKSDNSKIVEIAKIFEYNTLSTSKNKRKYITEEKQNIGNVPTNFSYNGLIYSFNPEINMFVNQYGHSIEISQAVSLMSLSQYESFIDVDVVDGSFDKNPTNLNPIAPTNLQVTNLQNDLFELSFINQDPNPEGFVIYIYQPDP